MPDHQHRHSLLVLLLVAPVCIAVAASGCGPSAEENPAEMRAWIPEDTGPQQPAVTPPPATNGQASDPPARPPQPQQPPADPLLGADPFREGSQQSGLPTDPFEPPLSGSAADLVKYIRELDLRQPQARSHQELVQELLRTMEARLAAADGIFAKQPSEEQRRFASESKLMSLRMLAMIDREKFYDPYQKFAADLSADADADLARVARLEAFRADLMPFMWREATDPQPVVDKVAALLADENAGEHELRAVEDAAEMLARANFIDQAAAVLLAAGQRFKDSADEALAEEARFLISQAQMFELQGNMEQVMKGNKELWPTVVEQLRQVLAPETLVPQLLLQMMELARNIEYSGEVAMAADVYALLEDALPHVADAEFTEQFAQALAMPQRRMALLNQPISVEGVTPEGEPFDWSKYQGKVVLVDFWATWCQPCMIEMENIRQVYDRFRDRGFEVVGVNLDQEEAALKRYIASADPPWAIVVAENPEERGFEMPLAVASGVDAIPFMLLVDQEGKVVEMHVRGARLGERVAELLDAASGGGKPPVGDAPGELPPPGAGSARGDAAGAQVASLLAAEEALLRDAFVPAAPVQPRTANVAPPPAVEKAVDADGELGIDLEGVNPYAPPADLSPAELVDYLLDMEEKPEVIRRRPGFREAVVDAANRVLAAAESSEKQREIAVLTKIAYLHRDASQGQADADEQLVAEIAERQDSANERIAAEVRFLTLERRALESDQLDADQIRLLLSDLKEFCEAEKLGAKHLRLASATVGTINRLEDGDERESYFAVFGKLFAASEHRQLARYGADLAKPPSGAAAPTAPSLPDLIGKPLELAGATTEGTEFRWDDYRGRPVLVQFWATTCGFCRIDMPHVRDLYEEHRERGLQVVGVSLDRDLSAVAKYLDENKITWVNLVGEGNREIARRYEVRGIPLLVLVDGEANVVAVGRKAEQLAGKVEEMLAEPAPAEAN